MSSLIGRFVLKVFFSALAGFFVFGILLVLGLGESRTGIERSTSPAFALLGAMVLGFFASKFTLSVDFADNKEVRKIATAMFWIAFLAAGSLIIWGFSGGENLGLTGDGFHRDFEWWQAFALTSGAFLAGLAVRKVVPRRKRPVY